jgi:glycogen synthase
VIGIVSRFAAQKGFDLIAQIMDRLAREEMIVVVLGSGDKLYEEMFQRLNKQFPNKIAAKVAFDNAIAHKIEAGADMFLMPSRYEPCGLNQIYSLKYGTVPIVRATGGLDDTIEPWDARTGKGTGFKFYRLHRRGAARDHQASLARLSRSIVLADAHAQRNGPRFFLGTAKSTPCARCGLRQTGLRPASWRAITVVFALGWRSG